MLTSLKLNLPHLQERMLRDAVVPLTKITILCGPNGSGKSTLLDAFREFVLANKAWTLETAPALVEGHVQGPILFFSMEKDNPRTADGRLLKTHEIPTMFFSREMSHGQSNFERLEEIFVDSRYDVIVLDEPENALDLDGLLWLRQALLQTSRQVVIATHSPLLLCLGGEAGVSIQSFGPGKDYPAKIIAAHQAVLQGKKAPKFGKRLPKSAFDKVKKSRRSVPTSSFTPRKPRTANL